MLLFVLIGMHVLSTYTVNGKSSISNSMVKDTNGKSSNVIGKKSNMVKDKKSNVIGKDSIKDISRNSIKDTGKDKKSSMVKDSSRNVSKDSSKDMTTEGLVSRITDVVREYEKFRSSFMEK